jgi:hypothetical protein
MWTFQTSLLILLWYLETWLRLLQRKLFGLFNIKNPITEYSNLNKKAGKNLSQADLHTIPTYRLTIIHTRKRAGFRRLFNGSSNLKLN